MQTFGVLKELLKYHCHTYGLIIVFLKYIQKEILKSKSIYFPRYWSNYYLTNQRVIHADIWCVEGATQVPLSHVWPDYGRDQQA